MMGDTVIPISNLGDQPRLCFGSVVIDIAMRSDPGASLSGGWFRWDLAKEVSAVLRR